MWKYIKKYVYLSQKEDPDAKVLHSADELH